MISYAGIIRIRSAGMISARPALGSRWTSTPKQCIYYTPDQAKNQADHPSFFRPEDGREKIPGKKKAPCPEERAGGRKQSAS